MKIPSDFHPDLKEDYLIKVAQLITNAYEDAIEHKLEDKGDTNWGLGCRRYEWARQNIRIAGGTEEYKFLSLLEDEGNKFTFMIGSVPMRFKKSDIDNLDKNIFTQYKNEAAQLSLLKFAGIIDPCELSWRMLMDVDFMGEVVRAVFIGATTEGVVKCFWEIPRDKLHGKPVVVLHEKDAGIEITPAKVTLKTAKESQQKKA